MNLKKSFFFFYLNQATQRSSSISNRWDFSLSLSLTLLAMLWIHIHWPHFSLRYFKALTFVSYGLVYVFSPRDSSCCSQFRIRESFDCFISSCSDVIFYFPRRFHIIFFLHHTKIFLEQREVDLNYSNFST